MAEIKRGFEGTSESKIKVMDQFEARPEPYPKNQSSLESDALHSSAIMVHDSLIQSQGLNEIVSQAIQAVSADQISHLSYLADKDPSNSSHRLHVSDIDFQSGPLVATPGSPLARDKLEVPLLTADVGLSDLKAHQDSPSKEELTPIGESSPRDNLKKYVENPTMDLHWLIGDKSGQSQSQSGSKRDTSFDEEVKSCRQQFLAETITEFILNELVAELRSENIYFKHALPQITEQQVSLHILEDPRYISESSEDDTIYGIRTNMNAVFEYCNLLVRFILDNYMDLLLEKFNHKPVQDSIELLVELREREANLQSPNNHWVDFAKGKLRPRTKERYFPEFIFTSLEDEIVSNYDNMNIMQNLFDMQKVYHKSIFDCFNEIATARWLNQETLDSYKVVVHGREYKSRSLVSVEELEQFIVSSKNQVVEYSTMMCGIIRDKEDSLIGNLKLMSPERVDLIREERLFRFLCFEVVLV